MTRLWQWYVRHKNHPIVLLVEYVALLYLVLLVVPDSVKSWLLDPLILTYISTAFMMVGLVMAIYTRWDRWTTLGAGLLASVAAASGLYMYSLAGVVDWRPLTILFRNEWQLDMLRSTFAVGATFLYMGVRHRRRKDPGSEQVV